MSVGHKPDDGLRYPESEPAKMNCAGCHAYDLTGGMGPDLTDPSWQYGSKPGEVYHTIAEGTPRGMPAWKDKMTADEIWQVVTYIQSKHQ